MSDSERSSEIASDTSARPVPAAAVGLAPSSRTGWSGVVLAAVAIAALAVVLVMAGIANEPAAINRGVMIGSVALLGAAAVVSVLCVGPWKQRSALNVLAALMTLSALGLALMLALGGFFNA